jgi:hypothetical protein
VEVAAVDLMLVYYLCADGVQFGQVARALNQSLGMRRRAAQYLCFGDPRSHTLGSVISVAHDRTDDGVILELPADLPCGVHDVKADVMGEGLVRAVLIGDEKGEILRATATADGVLYATVQKKAESSTKVTVGVRSAEASRDLSRAEKLFDELTFLLRYANEQANRSPSLSSELAALARKSVAIVGQQVPWKDGAFVAKAVFQRREKFGAAIGEEIGKAVAALYVDLVPKVGAYEAMAEPTLKKQFAFVSERQKACICGICGGPIDHVEWRSIVGHHTRKVGYCRRCGPAYDGNPETVRIAGVEERDESVVLHLACAPEDERPAAVTAVALIEPFGQSPLAVSPIWTARVQGESKPRLEIGLPADTKPGVCDMGAVAVVGASVTFMKARVQLRRGFA